MFCKKYTSWFFIVLFSVYIFTFQSGTVLGHAILLQAEPAANSQLRSSPEQIRLTFNERLEKQLFHIKVRDQRGVMVTNQSALLSEDQRQVQLNIPTLSEGVYTVSYQVISADGHPIKGAYIFTIGQAIAGTDEEASVSGPHAGHSDHDHGHGHMHDSHSLQGQLPLWFVRIIYFTSMLGVTGLAIWGLVIRKEATEIRQLHRRWTYRLLIFFIIALCGSGLFQFGEVLGESGGSDVIALLLGTNAGLSWTISLLLAVSGFFIILRAVWSDIIWVFLLLGAKSFNGHAMSAESPIPTLILNTIHLIAASLWVGGLLYIILLGSRRAQRRRAFIPIFSRVALVSIIVLVATGTLYTLLMLPKIHYVIYTLWGQLLLIKIVLVVGVIIVASIIRRHYKKRLFKSLVDGQKTYVRSNRLLHIDLALMLCIIVITSLFTILNPFPNNEPLHWHEMGDKIHMTAKITPNIPGMNRYEVLVWLPEQQNDPKRTQLLLVNQDKPDMGPIEVLLEQQDVAAEEQFFIGFHQYTYVGEGYYLSFAGNWEVEVRVMDNHDDEYVFRRPIKVY